MSHGVRQVWYRIYYLLYNIYHIYKVVLCKDGDGKIGLKVKAVNKGIFVCLVAKESPAALGGLR